MNHQNKKSLVSSFKTKSNHRKIVQFLVFQKSALHQVASIFWDKKICTIFETFPSMVFSTPLSKVQVTPTVFQRFLLCIFRKYFLSEKKFRIAFENVCYKCISLICSVIRKISFIISR